MRSKQGRKKKVYKKLPSGKTKIYFEGKKSKKKASCALCGRELAGVLDKRKLSRTKRKPSAIFAGVLCNECRSVAIEEAIKVKTGIKRLEDCEMRFRSYIERSLKLLE